MAHWSLQLHLKFLVTNSQIQQHKFKTELQGPTVVMTRSLAHGGIHARPTSSHCITSSLMSKCGLWQAPTLLGWRMNLENVSNCRISCGCWELETDLVGFFSPAEHELALCRATKAALPWVIQCSKAVLLSGEECSWLVFIPLWNGANTFLHPFNRWNLPLINPWIGNKALQEHARLWQFPQVVALVPFLWYLVLHSGPELLLLAGLQLHREWNNLVGCM